MALSVRIAWCFLTTDRWCVCIDMIVSVIFPLASTLVSSVHFSTLVVWWWLYDFRGWVLLFLLFVGWCLLGL